MGKVFTVRTKQSNNIAFARTNGLTSGWQLERNKSLLRAVQGIWIESLASHLHPALKSLTMGSNPNCLERCDFLSTI